MKRARECPLRETLRRMWVVLRRQRRAPKNASATQTLSLFDALSPSPFPLPHAKYALA